MFDKLLERWRLRSERNRLRKELSILNREQMIFSIEVLKSTLESMEKFSATQTPEQADNHALHIKAHIEGRQAVGDQRNERILVIQRRLLEIERIQGGFNEK